MRGLLNLYLAQFRTTIAVQFQYRAALIIWLIETILEPMIYMIVWSTVARSGTGQIADFAPADFAAYYILFMLVNHITFTWIMFEFEWRVRQGVLSGLLLRPVHPIHRDIAENITYKSLTMVVMVPTALALTWLFRPAFHFTGLRFMVFLLTILLAFLMRFLLEWSLALSAFWTTRTGAINQMYYIVLMFLSGEIAPLALLPEPLQWAAHLLPFRWMLGFPVETALGRLTNEQIVQGLLIQSAWIGVSLGLMSIMWRRGVRRYSAVGA